MAVEGKKAVKAQGGARVSWRDVLLVGTSALLSGIAVVVWNRRSLEKMRETRVVEEQPPVEREFI